MDVAQQIGLGEEGGAEAPVVPGVYQSVKGAAEPLHVLPGAPVKVGLLPQLELLAEIKAQAVALALSPAVGTNTLHMCLSSLRFHCQPEVSSSVSGSVIIFFVCSAHRSFTGSVRRSRSRKVIRYCSPLFSASGRGTVPKTP